jgi:hypothetical protein
MLHSKNKNDFEIDADFNPEHSFPYVNEKHQQVSCLKSSYPSAHHSLAKLLTINKSRHY